MDSSPWFNGRKCSKFERLPLRHRRRRESHSVAFPFTVYSQCRQSSPSTTEGSTIARAEQVLVFGICAAPFSRSPLASMAGRLLPRAAHYPTRLRQKGDYLQLGSRGVLTSAE